MSGNTLTLAGATSSTQFIVNTRTQFNGALFLYDYLAFVGTTSASKTIYANELTFTTNSSLGYGTDQTRFLFTTSNPTINSGAFTTTLLKLLMPVNTGTQAGNSKALVIDFNITTNAGVLTALETVRGNVLLNSTSGGTYIGYSSVPTNTIKLDVNGAIQFGTSNKTTTTDLGEFNVLALQNDAFLLFNGRTDFTWGIKKPNSTEIIIRANSGNDTQFVFNSSNRFGINIVPTSIIHTAASASVLAAGGVDVKGINFANTLVASHNNDKLIALDLNTTYTAGSFTGVNTIDLRTSGMNVVFGSSFGYGAANNTLNPEIDGVIQFIKNGNYGTKIILRPAGNPGAVGGGGGFTGNFWSSIEQNETGVYFRSGAYHVLSLGNGASDKLVLNTPNGTYNDITGLVSVSSTSGVSTALGVGNVFTLAITATVTGNATGGTLTTGTYYYRIVALDNNGHQAGCSNEYSAVIGAGVTTGSVAITNIYIGSFKNFRIYRGTVSGTYTAFYSFYGGISFTDTNLTPTSTGSFAPQTLDTGGVSVYNIGSLGGITNAGVVWGANFSGRQLTFNRKSAIAKGLYFTSLYNSDYVSELTMGTGTNYIFGNLDYHTATWTNINIAIGDITGGQGYTVMNNSTTIGSGFGYPTGTIYYTDSLVIGRSFGYGISATSATITKSTILQNGSSGFWTGSLSANSGTNKTISNSFIWKNPLTAIGDYRNDTIPDSLSNVVMFGSDDTKIFDVWFGNGGTGLLTRPDYTIHGSEVVYDPSAATIAGGGANLAFFNNISGGSLILAGGRGRGTGTPGDVILTTSTKITTGTTLQTSATRLIVKGDTGYIGIGTASPTTDLEISKSVGSSGAVNLKVTNTSSTGESAIVIKNDVAGEYGALEIFGSSWVGTSQRNLVAFTSSGANGFNVILYNNTSTAHFRITSTTSQTERFRLFGDTGNVLLKNGGTYTDIGYRLEVDGTSGTAASAGALKTTGKVRMSSLPTSTTGLASGDLWNNNGAVNIVP
jgi:hypothetical protein